MLHLSRFVSTGFFRAATRATNNSASIVYLSRVKMATASSNIYETPKYVQEYLAFHFGQDRSDYLPFASSAKDAVDFNVRIAQECAQLSSSGQHVQPTRALDIGCAVGRACFELAKTFDEVVGIDYSQSFVDCCNELKRTGSMSYERLDEGANYSTHIAEIAFDVDRSRCTFFQGDACSLDASLGTFDVILMANLLCRLPKPEDCLESLPRFVRPGGYVVITSPFSWLEQFTPKENWLGGYDGKSSRDGLVYSMEEHGFKLVRESAIPFLIREHARKYQLVFPHLSVFQRKV
eukprot:gene6960-7612_t